MSRAPRPASGVPDPRDRNLPAPTRALAAGLRALLDQSGDILADGLHRKRVAGISGQSRQTLYQHFPEQPDYLDAMLGLVLDPTHPTWQAPDLVNYVRDLVADTPTDSLAIVRQIAQHDFDGLLGDEHWQLVVTTWAMARDLPGVRARLGETWDHYNRRTAAALDELLDHWNATLLPPWDTRQAAHVFAALGEGLAMRALVLDDVDAELFANTVAAVAHAIVVPLDADQDAFVPVLPQPEPASTDRTIDPAAVERVIGALIDAYGRDNRAPSMTLLAREAGVSESSARAHFGDVDGALVATWRRLASDLLPTSHDPPTEATLDRLRRRLTALVRTMVLSPALTGALLTLCFRDPDAAGAAAGRRALDMLATPFEDLLRIARQTDVLAFGPTPPALARHLVTTAATQALAWPRPHGHRDPATEPIVEEVWALTIAPLLLPGHH
jgi:AcrR family transcriptional regulator